MHRHDPSGARLSCMIFAYVPLCVCSCTVMNLHGLFSRCLSRCTVRSSKSVYPNVLSSCPSLLVFDIFAGYPVFSVYGSSGGFSVMCMSM